MVIHKKTMGMARMGSGINWGRGIFKNTPSPTGLRMLSVSGPSDLSVGIALFAIHLKDAPLVGILVCVGMLPFIPHIPQNHSQCAGGACAGVFFGDKDAVCLAVIRSFHCISTSLAEGGYIECGLAYPVKIFAFFGHTFRN